MKKIFYIIPILFFTPALITFAQFSADSAYVDLRAQPATIQKGQSSVLSWSTSANVTSCTAGGGWSGSKITRGSQSVSPQVTTTYSLRCSYLTSSSQLRSVTDQIQVVVSNGSTSVPVSNPGSTPTSNPGNTTAPTSNPGNTSPTSNPGNPSQDITLKLENPFKCSGNDCTLYGLLRTIINKILLPIGGVIAVLAFIYSGFKFVMARGNSTELATAKRNLLYVAIGTAILLGAWVIANVIENTVRQLMP